MNDDVLVYDCGCSTEFECIYDGCACPCEFCSNARETLGSANGNGPSGHGVYFIRAGSGHVKIGRTRDLGTRIKSIATSTPEELSLIRWLPCADKRSASALERHMHGVFAADRVRLEWFRFSPEMLTVTPPPT